MLSWARGVRLLSCMMHDTRPRIPKWVLAARIFMQLKRSWCSYGDTAKKRTVLYYTILASSDRVLAYVAFARGGSKRRVNLRPWHNLTLSLQRSRNLILPPPARHAAMPPDRCAILLPRERIYSSIPGPALRRGRPNVSSIYQTHGSRN